MDFWDLKNSNYVVTNREPNSGNYKSESSSSYDNIAVSPTKTENRNASEKTRNRALLEEFISRRNDSTAQKGDRIRVKLKPKPNFKVILHVKVVEWALAMVGVTIAVRQVWFWVDCPKCPIFKIQSFWLILSVLWYLTD